MIYTIEIGVALSRPPAIHEYRLYVIEADNEYDADNIACQIAACSSVMPVSSLIIHWE